jgi:CheY-like chemotaxis protein
MQKLTFLIVEDEALIALLTSQLITEMGHIVSGMALSGEEAMEMIENVKPDVVVMDIILNGGMNGIEAAELIQENHGIPFIFISGNLDSTHMQKIEKLQHFGYLSKPTDPASLELAVKLAQSVISSK